MDPALERYQKQVLFAGIGETGQQRPLQSRALVVGCGALGSVVADQLVRRGRRLRPDRRPRLRGNQQPAASGAL
ncbi:MAG: ThiF family adenylyltransferase [Planctomycetaceae bacterium]